MRAECEWMRISGPQITSSNPDLYGRMPPLDPYMTARVVACPPVACGCGVRPWCWAISRRSWLSSSIDTSVADRRATLRQTRGNRQQSRHSLDVERCACLTAGTISVLKHITDHRRAHLARIRSGEDSVRRRRLVLPLALACAVGTGLGLSPVNAEASATSQKAAVSTASASAFAEATGFGVHTSPAAESVFHRSALAGATTPNPNLAIALTTEPTSALGYQATVTVTGLTSGSATVTVDWGNGNASTATVCSSSTSATLTYSYYELAERLGDRS